MIALLYFLFFAIYLLIAIWAVRASYRFAKTRYQRGWMGGLIAAFVMYNLVFWDLIPVLVMHKHYCETEAGFWVYKTPEQWIKENPEVVGEDWGSSDGGWNKFDRVEKLADGSERQRNWYSSRVYEDIIYSQPAHAIRKSEHWLMDANVKRPIARSVEFYRGSSGLGIGATIWVDYKIWLAMGHRYCGANSIEGYSQTFSELASKLINLGKGAEK